MAALRKILNISVSPQTEKEIVSIAKQEQKTKSEVVREAIRQYNLSKSLAEVYAYGRRVADKLGVETYDDVERIGG